MADKYLAILDAIEEALTTETASGGCLDDICSFFVLRTAAGTPPEYGSMTPVLIVRCPAVTGEITSIPACVVNKSAPVYFSLYTENGGDTTDPTAATILDTIEDLFNQQSFGLAYHVEAPQKTYNQTSFPPFAGNWNGAGELAITYNYFDTRGVELSTGVLKRSVSPDTLLTATSTLSIGYDELRIYGDATLTSTPTINPGVDGQVLRIVGLDDSLMPTIQDESSLPGSGIRLQQKLSFTFGIRDSMTLVYNSSQGIWREEGRADVY